MAYTPDFCSRFRILKGGKISLVVSALLAGSTMSFASPSGGTVTSGSATINQNGSVTTINQSTQKASINWNSFNIAPSETVNFVQPSAQSVTLNRVIGTTPSLIQGAMNANGQVFLLNPNGVLFANGSQINVGGLVASTLNITDENFQAGNYVFEGNSQNSIINMGTITTAQGGYVAMMGKSVANEGTIVATMGNVQMASGEKISLNLNGNSLVKLTIDQGTLNALVENKGLIKADGGQVYLTTQALNTILDGMVNNTGIIEAQTLNDVTGKVILFAHSGTANVGGEIKAEGGFVETSGDKVKIADDFKVKANDWLIDPVDFTIAVSGGDMTGAALSNNLASTSITIQSTDGSAGTAGDINVNDTITWTSGNTLTLTAQNDININSAIDASGGSGGKLALYYGQGTSAGGSSFSGSISGNTLTVSSLSSGALAIGQSVLGSTITALGTGSGGVGTYILSNSYGTIDTTSLTSANKYDFGLTSSGFAGKINLQAGSNFSTKLGSGGGTTNYTVITSLGSASDATSAPSTMTLQGIAATASLSGNYVLGSDIDASSTSTWNSNAGWTQIGTSGSGFTGNFDGLGHTIDSLNINRASTQYIGFFGYTSNSATVSDVGLTNANVNGAKFVGVLVGESASKISRSYATGAVQSGGNNAGGLIGHNANGTVSDSFSSSNVTDTSSGSVSFGGLIGSNEGKVDTSYATGAVQGNGSNIGGFAGYSSGTINNSYATGNVSGKNGSTSSKWVGGFVGVNNGGNIGGSNATGMTSYGYQIGGFAGDNKGIIENSYATGNIANAGNNAGGFIGYNETNNAQIKKSYATGNVTSNGTPVGGFAGSNVNGASITDSYSTGNATGSAVAGGFAGYNQANISKSYSTGSATGSGYVAGFVGNNIGGGVSNSFWNMTTSGSSTGIATGTLTGATGKTTAEMQTVSTFTDAGWTITQDATLSDNYPTLDSSGWKMKPLTQYLNYTLSTISSGYTYTGTAILLNTLWNAATIFGSDYSSWTTGTDYKFVYGGNDVSGFTNAGTYSGISVDILKSGYAASASGNSNGSLTIAKADATVTANSDTKTYNAQAQSVSGFSASGLVNGETESVLSGVSTSGGSGTNAGEYVLSASGTDGNYNLTFVDGKLTIVGIPTPSPSTPSAPKQEKVSNIITTIVNSTTYPLPTPKVVSPLAPQPQQAQNQAQNNTLLQSILPQESTNGGTYNLVGTTDGNALVQTVSMEALQQVSAAQGGISEIRVPLGQDSIVELVNGGVNLPHGVGQEFYVVDNSAGNGGSTNTKKVNKN